MEILSELRFLLATQIIALFYALVFATELTASMENKRI